MPQGRTKVIVTTAPRGPIKPRPLLRLTYSGPPIVKSSTDVLAIIRARCAGYLTEDEIAMVINFPAIEGPSGEAKPSANKPPAEARKSTKDGKKRSRRRGEGQNARWPSLRS